MQTETRPLQRPQKTEKKRPEEDTGAEEEFEPQNRMQLRVGRMIVAAVRNRLYESKEKFRLRKQLRAEKIRSKKLKNTQQRRKRVGRTAIDANKDEQ